MPDSEVLHAEHRLEYPYSRSVGPVIGAFFTGLRAGQLLGATGSDGTVIVPPTEYDPQTAQDIGELVEVGPGGVVESWAWVPAPRPKHPLDRPFAWALIRLDGAGTSMLHVVDSGGPDRLTTGDRVVVRFRPPGARIGSMADIECFVPEVRDGAETREGLR
ncbi:MAG: Zn-ribbon domain-containing OB-fold protein [Acidimicrobiales bacterium]